MPKTSLFEWAKALEIEVPALIPFTEVNGKG